MSGRPVIDSVEFARLGSTLKGEVPNAELARLQDQLADRSGRVAYRLTGRSGPQGQPGLRLTLSGVLMLRCQRCLEPLNFAFNAERDFVLTQPGDPETDLGEEGEAMDYVPADPKLDVIGLVEEEVMLSLPMAPRHPPGQCEPAQPVESLAKQNSPFGALAALKRDPKS